MTAITVTAIAAVAVIVTTFVMPSIKNTITNKTACAQAYDCGTTVTNGKVTCYWDKPDDTATGGYTKTEVKCALDS